MCVKSTRLVIPTNDEVDDKSLTLERLGNNLGLTDGATLALRVLPTMLILLNDILDTSLSFLVTVRTR